MVYYDTDRVDIVVKTEGLTDEEVMQMRDIAIRETSVPVENISIVGMQILDLFRDIQQICGISVRSLSVRDVENGYRVDDQVLHSVMDVLIPYKFRLQTYLIQDVQEIYLGLKKNRPTLALVPADYLSKTDEKNEQAIAIIGYIDEKFILITPSEKTIITRKAEEIIPQIQKAWIIGI